MKTTPLLVLVVAGLTLTAFAEDTLAKITNGELRIGELALWQVLEVLEELVTQHYHTILVALAVISMVVGNVAFVLGRYSTNDCVATFAAAFAVCSACFADTYMSIYAGFIGSVLAFISAMYIHDNPMTKDKVIYWSISGVFYITAFVALNE